MSLTWRALSFPLPLLLLLTACSKQPGSTAGGGTNPPPATPQSYTIGGSVSGIVGTALVLQNNGGDDVSLSASGSFTFAKPVDSGKGYAVSVKTQPASPAQTCTVLNGSGTVGSANIGDVSVSCALTLVALSTAVGTPSGDANGADIGSAGGTLASADGRLSITVPPDALSGTQHLSIQPITNQTPGGINKAFRLQPEGTSFAAPVTLTWHFSDADLNGTFAQALGVAYQGDDGIWHKVFPVTLDADGKTLSVTSTHFSDWSMLSGLQLSPGAATVRTKATLAFAVGDCQRVRGSDALAGCANFSPSNSPPAEVPDPPQPDGSPDDDLLAAPLSIWAATDWAVNGTPGGDPANTFGTVISTGRLTGLYTAPDSVPSPATVAVSAKMLTRGKPTGVSLVANVTIVDTSEDYHGTLSASQGNIAYTADIMETLTEKDPEVDLYTISGTVTVPPFSDSDGNQCAFNPNTGSFFPQTSLTLFHHVGGAETPNSYTFNYSFGFNTTLTCTSTSNVVTVTPTYMQGAFQTGTCGSVDKQGHVTLGQPVYFPFPLNPDGTPNTYELKNSYAFCMTTNASWDLIVEEDLAAPHGRARRLP